MKSLSIIHWHNKPPQSISTSLQRLLTTTGLLTLKLSVQCGNALAVSILNEGLALCLEDEARALNLPPDTKGWVRTVLLLCQHKPVLYARSFIPLANPLTEQAFIDDTHPFSDLKHIGKTPLGIWLAQHPELSRSPFEFALTPAQHWPNWDGNQPKHQLATRRSCFNKQSAQLLLSEVFLCDH